MRRLRPKSSLRPIATYACVAIAILAAVEVFGMPHIRWSYRYTGSAEHPDIISARYWSLTGAVDVHRVEMGERMPFIALLPLDPPLHVRIWRGLRSLASY